MLAESSVVAGGVVSIGSVSVVSATLVGGCVRIVTCVTVFVSVLHAPSTTPTVPPAAVRMNCRRSMPLPVFVARTVLRENYFVIQLPASKAFGEDERSVLLGYLTYHRTVLARKVDGLTDEQGRRAGCPPSKLTLLGLLRHMTDVERWWFRRVLLADDIAGIFPDEAEWDVADATVADSLAAFWEEIEVVDRHLLTADMDDRMLGGSEPGQNSLRRIIVHMIEEYARHCGHAELLREAIDGATGD